MGDIKHQLEEDMRFANEKFITIQRNRKWFKAFFFTSTVTIYLHCTTRLTHMFYSLTCNGFGIYTIACCIGY